jgi:hypothetical protein
MLAGLKFGVKLGRGDLTGYNGKNIKGIIMKTYRGAGCIE